MIGDVCGFLGEMYILVRFCAQSHERFPGSWIRISSNSQLVFYAIVSIRVLVLQHTGLGTNKRAFMMMKNDSSFVWGIISH